MPGSGRRLCHTSHQCGATSWEWSSGPHAHLGAFEPRELARESLRWFEDSLEAAAWRGNPSAWLELDYPSLERHVTARFDPAAGLSWEEQLRAWFAGLPRGGAGPVDLGDQQFYWGVDFAGRGSVSGSSASDREALQAMRSVLASLPPSRLFERPAFRLAYAVRPSPRVMNSYGEEVQGLDELDELPARVAAKVAHYARD